MTKVCLCGKCDQPEQNEMNENGIDGLEAALGIIMQQLISIQNQLNIGAFFLGFRAGAEVSLEDVALCEKHREIYERMGQLIQAALEVGRGKNEH